MQWSVHIAGPEDLDGDLTPVRFASLETSNKLQPPLGLTVRLIERRFGEVRFTRCAFGTEFCEHLLPPEEILRAAASAARARGLGFTFLTPYVSDSGIRRLRELFAALDDAEVVFNDWGVLRLLRRGFPRLVPVEGRLLNKSLRDPRVMGVYGETDAASGAAAATLGSLQRSSLDCSSYTGLLGRLGVAGVEMDNLPQGMDLSFTDRGVALAVYLPFGFISTSRACMAAGLHYRKPDKFQPGAPCRHQCQSHLVEYAYTNSPFSNRDQKFYLKGNTYFYVHTEKMLEGLFDQASSGRVSRLVFQPRLPVVESSDRHSCLSFRHRQECLSLLAAS
jgi:hypothetical protein